MFKRTSLHLFMSVALSAGVTAAYAQPYPMLDKVVAKVNDKYAKSTCQQLAADKANKQPPSDIEKRAVDMMHKDPNLRKAFLDQVAPTIVNKMFECGFIP